MTTKAKDQWIGRTHMTLYSADELATASEPCQAFHVKSDDLGCMAFDSVDAAKLSLAEMAGYCDAQGEQESARDYRTVLAAVEQFANMTKIDAITGTDAEEIESA